MPDQMSDKQKWPEVVVLARRPDAPQLGRWETTQNHADAHGFDSERYIPLHSIRERLTSDEAVEAMAAYAEKTGARIGPLALKGAVLTAIAAAFPDQDTSSEGGVK